MTDREKILIALREKPLKAFEIMKRVNIKHEDDCQSLLLKMRDDGAVKFDIHKGYWRLAAFNDTLSQCGASFDWGMARGTSPTSSRSGAWP